MQREYSAYSFWSESLSVEGMQEAVFFGFCCWITIVTQVLHTTTELLNGKAFKIRSWKIPLRRFLTHRSDAAFP